MNIVELYQNNASDAEVANEALRLIIEQGAFGHNGKRCTYYDEQTGNKCAVGILLPEPEAFASFEGGIADMCEEDLIGKDELGEALQHYEETLNEVQGLHDACAENEWEALISRIYNILKQVGVDEDLMDAVISLKGVNATE